jgi:hypothetical protein
MALESEDMKQITNAVVDILNNCIITRGVKVSELATFDIEYLFLNVRSKSVGEKIEVNVTCPDDNETKVTLDIDIDAIKVQKDKKHTDTVKLDDSLFLKLKYPSLDQFVQSNFEYNENDADVDQSLDMIVSCIDLTPHKKN